MASKTDQGDRLRLAREAKYRKSREAAAAMGVKEATYNHHENGTNGLSRAGERYARFFKVNLDWLMTGHGPMRAMEAEAAGAAVRLPLRGHVGAGYTVDWRDDALLGDDEFVTLPDGRAARALLVKGDSQHPRFMDGEVLLVAAELSAPTDLLGHYAVVQDADGRTLIKILHRGHGGDDRFHLESHNAPLEENVKIVAAWRYLGTLASRDAEALGPRPAGPEPVIAREKTRRRRRLP